MQFCFIQGDTVLTMPVTPPDYDFAVGRKMETINISALGEVFRPGGRSRWSRTFPFLLPAHEYSFMEPGTRAEPQYYLDQLKRWSLDDKPVRLIITETDINLLVYIEDATVREQDGSGDRYVDVAVREFVDPLTPIVGVAVQGARQSADGAPEQEQSWSIKKGETLGMICRRFYGNSGAKYYNALASHNGIKNPHLIYAGQTIRIPPEAVLFGGGK
ncbi:MAG: LysM peptidoglycan-binding domain-containing protein [Oscillospiraceae bacterium]|nr:LysM peptidoglycan-binding domain-containing protein [Oscillospiraceae bacterium]